MSCVANTRVCGRSGEEEEEEVWNCQTVKLLLLTMECGTPAAVAGGAAVWPPGLATPLDRSAASPTGRIYEPAESAQIDGACWTDVSWTRMRDVLRRPPPSPDFTRLLNPLRWCNVQTEAKSSALTSRTRHGVSATRTASPLTPRWPRALFEAGEVAARAEGGAASGWRRWGRTPPLRPGAWPHAKLPRARDESGDVVQARLAGRG